MEFKKITTVQEAFAATGRDYSKRPDLSMLSEADARHLLNNFDLKVVVEAINMEDGKRWLPDFREDNDERKYCPYFWIKADDERPGGFGFSRSGCGLWYTDATAGSRLCFRDRARWEYCTEQFKALWQEEWIIKP